MRTYERNSVHVDQCTECRGIFLDRGELERLIDAEQGWHAGGSTPAPPPASAPSSVQGTAATGGLGAIVGEVLQQAKAAKSSSSGGYDPRYGHPKKKKSFLDELFG